MVLFTPEFEWTPAVDGMQELSSSVPDADHLPSMKAIDWIVSRRHTLLRGGRIALAHVVLTSVALYVFLQGWRRDLRVPFGFSRDTLYYLMLSKSTVENGWWWSNPMLAAPSSFNHLLFPANSNVDQTIVWAVSRVVSDAILTVNLAWILMVVLSGLSAGWCMRRLGVSTTSSIVAGALYALTPYALFRNIDHFGLVIYLLPFVCTLALLLALGGPADHRYWRGTYGFLLGGCALLGLNYIYYAFFGCFLVVVGSLVGALANRSARTLLAGGLSLAVIAGCTLLSLAPSLAASSREGKPILLHDKKAAEAEVYGLKIRQLVGPVPQHSIPLLRQWTDKEAAAYFPLENENQTSRLGLVGTIGFLGLLGLLLCPSIADRFASGSVLLGASRLTLAAVLLGTIGGFGSLFSLFVSPEIRAYNRLAPFIAFFALAAVALLMDALSTTRARRMAVAVGVLALGLADQRVAAKGLNVAHAHIAAETHAVEGFVNQIEQRLPARAMVLQLPFRTFLAERGSGRMLAYDHLKLYVVSHRIHWSYPGISNEQIRWQLAASTLDPRRLVFQLAAEGFSAIVVDRYGYQDNGDAITSVLTAAIDGNSTLASTERYLAIDIRSLAGKSDSGAPSLSTSAPPATLTLSRCEGAPASNIDTLGGIGAPNAAPLIHLPGSNSFTVEGWAVDEARQVAAGGLDVVVDNKAFQSLYGLDRPDVADHFRRSAYLLSGFMAEIPPGSLTAGAHTLSLRVISSTRECYYEGPGIPIVIE